MTVSESRANVPILAPVPRIALCKLEAAQALGISERSLDHLVGCGRLRTVRVGRRVLIPVVELGRFIAAAVGLEQRDA